MLISISLFESRECGQSERNYSTTHLVSLRLMSSYTLENVYPLPEMPSIQVTTVFNR